MTIALVLVAAWVLVALLLGPLVPELSGVGRALWPFVLVLVALAVGALVVSHGAQWAEERIPRAVAMFDRRRRP